MQFSQPQANVPWWVKIDTSSPKCTYFFGPFEDASEAQRHRPGYFDDLYGEGAEGIDIAIEQGNPKELTISDDQHLLVQFPPTKVSSTPITSLRLVS